MFNPDQPQAFSLAEELRDEFVISASGMVRERDEQLYNDKIPTGGVELVVDELRILNRAETLPIQPFADDNQAGEELRLKYRFLDLRRGKVQTMLKKRAEMYRLIHQYMDEREFLEVQTPILANSSPEGARDFLIPSRLQENKFYALPQAPQQFKQGRWPPRGRRRHAMAVRALVPPDAARVAARGATVYTNAPKRHREAVFADLCTLLRPHGRSRDRAGSRVPRHRRPHGPRDARALGPEAHAARAVTQPPTRTHEASKILYIGLCKTARILKRSYKFLKTLNIMAMVVSESPKD